MNALLAQFIPEARDLLEQAGTGMLALERDHRSQSVINDVFRAVHTLKGSSGLFDIAPLTRLVHAAEDLLGEVRTGQLEVTPDIVDRLLDSLDLVGQWIDSLEAREKLPVDAEGAMAERVAVLRQWLEPRETGAAGGAATAEAPLPPPDWLGELAEADRMAAFSAVSAGPLVAWSFRPDEGCFFRGDDPLAMVRQSPGLLALRVLPQDGAFPDLAGFDPLTSILAFEILSRPSAAGIEEHMRYAAEAVEIRPIEAADLALPAGSSAGGPVFGDFGRLAQGYLDSGDAASLAHAAATLLGMVAGDSFQASALRWCQLILATSGLGEVDLLARMVEAVATGVLPPRRPAAASIPTPAPAVSSATSSADPAERRRVHAVAREQLAVLETQTDAAVAGGRLESVGAILVRLGRASGLDLEADVAASLAPVRASGDLTALRAVVARLEGGKVGPAPGPSPIPAERADVAARTEPEPRAAEAPEAAAPEVKPVGRVLRIDQSKIDSIMNLVAELIVAKNGLSYLATRAEEVHGARAVAREIKDQFAVIDRITQGLQVGVMSVRMMPVGQVFQRFPRLVRDISRKLGKKIELVIEGEDTEADKNVLESLADPLIHMVRNSLDHGIELPEDRLAAGKSEHGTLRITARQENDFVVIEVRDDGKGIDPDAVKRKCVASGVITAERAAQMSDEEAANLVFAAGFSTKEVVSDLSGRGVGMDVVRSAVVKAGGDVMLRSTLGQGTSVVVRLPLTMAVTRIVTIDCQGRIFGIPMDLVVETVRLKTEDIHRFKDMETFVLRDAIIPIVRLARLLDLPAEEGASEAAGDEAVMVVRIGRERVGVIVDGFRERMEVIVKPLEGVLDGMPGFSGTALLGDGRVLLILDLQEML
ncbi:MULTISPECIES: chemotaxis protein CheA [unclassified Aureimonas]|uniref:chemotaxis protein CheA n=1 Tax=unclassified Aureimonas TaxID=2615206 RepID=UPI0006F7AD62|nr:MULTISPECIES: chemotaxis protein CheA [unclassified Aureimonas]KQT69074.1 hypothetical protein ASG54_05350 [Aureimonas sp. Leaf460]KQT69312.1 hypothetical protein ASG62_17955 [Aureimonas sp. Leaf427]